MPGKVWAPKYDWGDDGRHSVVTELDSDQPETKPKKVKKPKKTSKDRPSGRRR